MNWTLAAVVQVPNALGATSTWVVGGKRRWGWLLGIGSEFAWAAWAFLAHQPGVYPWCVIWAAFFARNWWKWSHEDSL